MCPKPTQVHNPNPRAGSARTFSHNQSETDFSPLTPALLDITGHKCAGSQGRRNHQANAADMHHVTSTRHKGQDRLVYQAAQAPCYYWEKRERLIRFLLAGYLQCVPEAELGADSVALRDTPSPHVGEKAADQRLPAIPKAAAIGHDLVTTASPHLSEDKAPAQSWPTRSNVPPGCPPN